MIFLREIYNFYIINYNNDFLIFSVIFSLFMCIISLVKNHTKKAFFCRWEISNRHRKLFIAREIVHFYKHSRFGGRITGRRSRVFSAEKDSICQVFCDEMGESCCFLNWTVFSGVSLLNCWFLRFHSFRMEFLVSISLEISSGQ